jgi:PleD family two-component response regulator
MVQPLAIILNDRVVVGAQLEEKLEALDYRVKVTDDRAGLASLALELKPLVVLVDLAKAENLEAAAALMGHPETRHVPMLGYAPDVQPGLQTRANQVGVSLVITDSAVLQHLKQLLDQALRVD